MLESTIRIVPKHGQHLRINNTSCRFLDPYLHHCICISLYNLLDVQNIQGLYNLPISTAPATRQRRGTYSLLTGYSFTSAPAMVCLASPTGYLPISQATHACKRRKPHSQSR